MTEEDRSGNAQYLCGMRSPGIVKRRCTFQPEGNVAPYDLVDGKINSVRMDAKCTSPRHGESTKAERFWWSSVCFDEGESRLRLLRHSRTGIYQNGIRGYGLKSEKVYFVASTLELGRYLTIDIRRSD